MDYRRRYLRRLANQSQRNPKEELLNDNKTEEKVIPTKVEEKSDNRNAYLQNLLVKNNNTQSSSTINLSSVNDSLPSFKSNIRDILATEENKQRAIKYVIHKRNEEKFRGKSPLTTDNNEQEESNPALAGKYYRNTRNINTNLNNTSEKKQPEVNNNQNQNNSDSKYAYPHYYTRRNRNYGNLPKDSQENQIESNNKDNKYEIINNAFSRKRFQVSASATNIINPNNNEAKDGGININNSVYIRRDGKNNLKANENTTS